ncbi:TIGR02530 family flagellar biosynthesis protein [Paenibacillus sp. GD4]|jgi:flagellar operon protein|uniref:TIGR02530 family flagellar biosynthesis protein n=1 Tax=Paenibacillus sp. GD4 TaxID=3068890 RepID=UPI0027968713|nr:TIGR02530 family flagellar biosynthesis protein [Paenibacillus sp. GD4]MDQ1913313.1 TIGR02530 family flagellar biosynthesis protein [Paenibacillus sp. GD4]
MTERISIGQLYPNAVPPARTRQPVTPAKGSSTFDQILQNQFVRVSHHAEERIRQRGIELKPEQLAKINHAIDKAAKKGAKDSLMLLGDTAFIVNIKNRTIVTAMDGDSMKDNVFTQIDSAMVIT